MRLHAKVLGSLTAVHVAHQDAVLDEDFIRSGRTLIIYIHRQRGTAAIGQGVGIVHHGDKVGGDPLAQVVRGHRAAQHQVGLYGVAHGLVRQNTGQRRSQHNILQPRVGKDALALLHQQLHLLVQLFVVLAGVGKVVGKDALAAAQHIKDLNRHPIGRVSGKLHDQMGAGPHAVAVGAVADSQQLLHAVMAQQHPAA